MRCTNAPPRGAQHSGVAHLIAARIDDAAPETRHGSLPLPPVATTEKMSPSLPVKPRRMSSFVCGGHVTFSGGASGVMLTGPPLLLTASTIEPVAVAPAVSDIV